MSQTTVTQYGAAGIAGLIYDTGDNDVTSFSAEGVVGLGAPVQLGTNGERQVKALTTSAGQAALARGISVAGILEQASGVVAYAAGQSVGVLKAGRIWVNTDDAVVAGAKANLKLSSGLFTDEVVAAGIEAFTLFTATFITGTTAAGLAVVEIK